MTRKDVLAEFQRRSGGLEFKWSRRAVLSLLDEVTSSDPLRAAWRLPVWIEMAMALEMHFPAPSTVSPLAAYGRLRATGLARNKDVYWRLVDMKVLPEITEETRQLVDLRKKCREKLDAVQGDWAKAVLESFFEHLVRRHERAIRPRHEVLKKPFKCASVVANLSWAIQFVEWVHAKHVRNVKFIGQKHFEEFHLEVKGSRNIMGRWIAYLNKFREGQVGVKAIQRSARTVRCLLQTERHAHIREWLNADGSDARTAFVGLMVGCYAAKLTHLCVARMSDVTVHESGATIRHGKVKCDIHPAIASVLVRWMTFRAGQPTLQHSSYLFPRTKFGGHISSMALGRALKIKGINIKRLYAAGILAFLDNENPQPGLLVAARGVSRTTANAYFDSVNPVARRLAPLIARTSTKSN